MNSQIIRNLFQRKNKLQNLLKCLENKQKELEKKKAVYFDGIENGKISFDLLAEKLEQIKAKVEKNQNLILETEERLLEIPDPRQHTLSKKELTDHALKLAEIGKPKSNWDLQGLLGLAAFVLGSLAGR